MVVSMSACGGSKDAGSSGDSSNATTGDSSNTTEGRVTAELYSDSALGDYTTVFDELMLGSVDVEHISPVESYDARVSATMLP